MKLTNRAGLPQALFDAVANDPYTRGDSDMSVTQILKPPRMVALETKHADEIEEDASDRIWSLVGQIAHGILERANKTGIAERRMSIDVDGCRISGGMDLYTSDGTISDYKFVTAYKFKNGEAPEEYEQQLNCYAEILRQNGEKVSGLEIVAILRDWSKLEARREPSYPQTQVIRIRVPLWPAEKAQAFLRNRVMLHIQAKSILPECSTSDRWARPSKWAVMKTGKDRAVKLYDNEADAISHASTDKSLRVEARPGESIRCAAYCGVSRFCAQYQQSQNAQRANEVA